MENTVGWCRHLPQPWAVEKKNRTSNECCCYYQQRAQWGRILLWGHTFEQRCGLRVLLELPSLNRGGAFRLPAASSSVLGPLPWPLKPHWHLVKGGPNAHRGSVGQGLTSRTQPLWPWLWLTPHRASPPRRTLLCPGWGPTPASYVALENLSPSWLNDRLHPNTTVHTSRQMADRLTEMKDGSKADNAGSHV